MADNILFDYTWHDATTRPAIVVKKGVTFSECVVILTNTDSEAYGLSGEPSKFPHFLVNNNDIPFAP